MLEPENPMEDLYYDRETGIFRWTVTSRGKLNGAMAGHKKKNGYIIIGVKGFAIRAHRLAWFAEHGVWPAGQIDHLNRVRSDNRIVNLRDVKSAENNHNRSLSKGNTSGHMGAFWNRSSCRWQSQIMANGKMHYLGLFDTAEAAGAAYQEAKMVLHPSILINDDLRRLNHSILKEGVRK